MASDKALYEAHREGWTYSQIADLHSLNIDSVRSRVGRYYRANFAQKADLTPFPVKGYERHQPMPKFVQMPVLRRPIVIAADFHMPTGEWPMIELLCKFGEKHLPAGERELAIVGDLVNFDILSQYDHISPPVPLEVELDYAEGLLDYLLTVYDRVYMALGNHDHRLIKHLAGDFGASRLGRLITRHMDTGRFVITHMSQMIAVSAGQIWRLTHQRAYSRNKGVVANKLSQKHLSNTITHHQHHVSMLRDEWNRWTLIDNGMMGDYEKMAYVQLVDNTAPVMCSSFTFLRNGTGHLLTPYPTLTDWSMWDMEWQAVPAIESAAAKMARLTMPDEQVFDVAERRIA